MATTFLCLTLLAAQNWMGELNFDRVDAAGEDTFNRILWSIIKGSQPYPGTKRMSGLDIAREH